ncbi:MAG: type II toxin-antitoxin system HicB family antitoxin [Candidatus Omnitrophica bacterium]|nr:type II toxin-antitoxin system HicB family antitoxin [Candidatus Omnitrophota bacterium]MBU4140458.1 type II toxin-antitoxin system HicB family antitoxin [Candidatus Omnitrophota bacterium]
MHRLQISAELIPDPKNGGYTVYCPEFDIMTQGDDPDQAITNLKEALRGYIKVVGIKQAFKEYRHPIRELVEIAI